MKHRNVAEGLAKIDIPIHNNGLNREWENIINPHSYDSLTAIKRLRSVEKINGKY